ncbi:50S ribosomal protein L4 [Metamycoplasma phocicerebrale]|uniref:Large ribosomal subunit protein uL4 n=1 Tax=Metamycoplasma phocicerebrale TaxID=142649 RepID=A0A3Q9VAB2_9BACT|nr:50S ribosomal protein L4 [Metamycoplasma phocicerebrale]AZZ65592.1 50S ribosomal protein L4 [Metamycoplasma phocicerebrale]
MTSVVEKYYISEKFDKNRNISFNFKKAKEKISGNFANFLDAVNEFINVSEKSKNSSRVWFHRNGAYSGSVDLEKAIIIANRVSEAKIENEKAIEYIEKENLIDKPAPKVVKTVKSTENSKPKKEDLSNLPKSVFGLEKIHTQSVFDAILAERGSKRFATHKVKTRGEVSGTGKKPWPQKHTGNARAGSQRSPIFVGGGRAFGPTVERNYNLKINKKARKNALFSALTMLANAKSILVRDYKLKEISTRALLVELNKDNLINLKNILIVSSDEILFKSARNLPNVNVSKVTSLSIESLVAADVLVISNEDIKFLEGMAK